MSYVKELIEEMKEKLMSRKRKRHIPTLEETRQESLTDYIVEYPDGGIVKPYIRGAELFSKMLKECHAVVAHDFEKRPIIHIHWSVFNMLQNDLIAGRLMRSAKLHAKIDGNSIMGKLNDFEFFVHSDWDFLGNESYDEFGMFAIEVR